MHRAHTSVLVVGAGPTGLTLASQLARLGVDVRIIDNRDKPQGQDGALLLWSQTLALLKDVGDIEPFLHMGVETRNLQAVCIWDGQDRLGSLDCSAHGASSRFALTVKQSAVERQIAAQLAGRGVEVERSTSLSKCAQTGDGVSAELVGADGATETVHVDWLVGCDGRHSTVRRGLGTSSWPEASESRWIVAHGKLSGLQRNDGVQVVWHQDGIVACFPFEGSWWRIMIDRGSRMDDTSAPQDSMESINAILADRIGAATRISDLTCVFTQVGVDWRSDWMRKGRVFLAGDAAHSIAPVSTMGLNLGMHDAFNLAWKLAMVVRGAARESMLDSYEAERLGVVNDLLEMSKAMHALATVRGPQVRALRNTMVQLTLKSWAARGSKRWESCSGWARRTRPVHSPWASHASPSPRAAAGREGLGRGPERVALRQAGGRMFLSRCCRSTPASWSHQADRRIEIACCSSAPMGTSATPGSWGHGRSGRVSRGNCRARAD